MQNTRSSLIVVIAALNEEEGIGPTLEELQRFLEFSCLLVIDGNSHDKTVEVAKKMGAEVVVQDGTGKGDALFQGLRHVGSDIRYVVFIDADFTYPAEVIPKMVEVLEQEPDVGMVIGDRFSGQISAQNSLKDLFYLGNRLIAFAQHMLNGIRLNDPLSGLRVVRADILRNWAPKSQGFDIEAEINFFVEREGYRIVEIPIDYRYRLGEKKLKLQHGIGILKRILTESFAM
jgi:glycosyltransferase involved in cell wall biosynthesis